MEGIVALFPKVLIDLGVVLFHMGNCCLGFCRETISELSKSIRCVFGWLVLRFVVEENDLHHAYVVVNGNKLILW